MEETLIMDQVEMKEPYWLKLGILRGHFVAAALASALAIAPTPGLSAGETPIGKGFVYSGDEHSNSISRINLATGQVEITPVTISPHNVQITAGGEWLLAVGDPARDSHGGDGHGVEEVKGRLLVFNAMDMAAGPAAVIEVGSHPAHVVADHAGQRAFITNSGDYSVAVVDLTRNKVIQSIATGRYPHGLRISPDGREIYVANVQDGSVSVLNAADLAEAARIPVGTAPVQVGFTPDGSRVYVSLRDENRVAVIDTSARKVIGTIEVGRNPIQVHATPDGRYVYVANQGTEAAPAETVSVIEVATGSVIDTIRTGKGAHGVAVSDDGTRVFITNIVDATVSVIDAAARTVIATFPVGRGPNGITFRPGED